MSKLCAYCLSKGCCCSGSDRVESSLLVKLRKLGANVYAGSNTEIAAQADIVVYSAAISADDPELLSAKTSIERKNFLKHFIEDFDKVVAFSGAHGKTTATAMLSWIMLCNNSRFTSHIGGELQGIDSLACSSGNECLVLEACEYNRSFLAFESDIGVILNVDFDHPDSYANEEDLYYAFAEFAEKSSEKILINDAYDSKIIDLCNAIYCKEYDDKLITFGKNIDSAYSYNEAELSKGILTFTVYKKSKYYSTFMIHTLNSVTVESAIAVIACADLLGIAKNVIVNALSTFPGVKRRGECLGQSANGARVITDYAHHPSEIEHLLISISKVSEGRVVLVFEPHTFSRTKALFSGFKSALKNAEILYLLPTYPAREQPICGVDSETLHKAIQLEKKNSAMCNYSELPKLLSQYADDDIILLVGAGIEYEKIYADIK